MNFLLNWSAQISKFFSIQPCNLINLVRTFMTCCVLWIYIASSFAIAKKFVNAELNKLGGKTDTQFERLIILASGVMVSSLIVLTLMISTDAYLEHFFNGHNLLYETYFKPVAFLAGLLIFSYMTTAPLHPDLRFLIISDDEASSMHKKIVRIVGVSFSIMTLWSLLLTVTTESQKLMLGYICSSLLALYFFVEMMLAENTLRQALSLVEQETTFFSVKLVSFINAKIMFLILTGMFIVIVKSTAKSEVFFLKNFLNIYCAVIEIFALQMIISKLLNKFLTKLSFLMEGIKGKLQAAQNVPNLVWITDVTIIILYSAILYILLKIAGINLDAHLLRDKVVSTGIIAFITVIVYRGFNEFTSVILEKAKLDSQNEYGIKLQTFLPILSVVFYIVLTVTSLLLILANLGVDIAPILATFTVFSAAIALASQDTIKSFLQGIIFLIEKNLFIGARVQINGMDGTIEKLSVRSLYLRGLSGEVYMLPYSVISTIVNYSQDYSYYYGELYLTINDDIEKISKTLIDVVTEMRNEEKYSNVILSDATIYGMKPFNLSGLKLCWMLKTSPNIPGATVKFEIYRRLYLQYKKLGMNIPIADTVITPSA